MGNETATPLTWEDWVARVNAELPPLEPIDRFGLMVLMRFYNSRRSDHPLLGQSITFDSERGAFLWAFVGVLNTYRHLWFALGLTPTPRFVTAERAMPVYGKLEAWIETPYSAYPSERRNALRRERSEIVDWETDLELMALRACWEWNKTHRRPITEAEVRSILFLRMESAGDGRAERTGLRIDDRGRPAIDLDVVRADARATRKRDRDDVLVSSTIVEQLTAPENNPAKEVELAETVAILLRDLRDWADRKGRSYRAALEWWLSDDETQAAVAARHGLRSARPVRLAIPMVEERIRSLKGA